MKKTSKAFSLAELSIVLIIIGLLVAGVSSGGKMIEQYKMRSLINQMQNHKTAVHTFELTYDALPGDMNNALDYWTGVLNGNGDGNVPWDNESKNANFHMAKAEIIPDGGVGNGNGDYAIYMEGWTDVRARVIYNTNSSIVDSNMIEVGKGMHAETEFLTAAEAYNIDKKIDDAIPNSGIMGHNTNYNSNCTVSNQYPISTTDLRCNILYAIGL